MLIATVLAAPLFAGAPDYFTEKEKDFGVTALGPALINYFPIKNTSKETITMGTPLIQCGCVGAKLHKAQLAPGETTYLEATMNTSKIPTAQIGQPKSVTVRIPFLTPTLEEVTLKVSCIARPDLVWSTTDGVVFGTLTSGKGGKATMKVTLFNNPKWEIKEVKSGGDYVKAEFKQASKTASEVSYDIVCTLDEKCPVGSWMSELTVVTNAPGIEKMRVPVTVTVSKAISTSPEKVEFSQPMGGNQTQDVTINGLQAFKVLGVKGGDESLTVAPKTEGSRHQHVLKVDFKAAATGELKREITVLTDSKEMPTVVIPVSAIVKK